eukprot:3820621-Rhodomonas_salina.1
MKLDKVMEHLGKAKSADAAAQAIAKVRLGLVWDVACVSARVAPRASLLLQQTTVDDREGAEERGLARGGEERAGARARTLSKLCCVLCAGDWEAPDARGGRVAGSARV